MELAVINLALNRLLIGQTIDQITAQVSFQLSAKTFRYSNSTQSIDRFCQADSCASDFLVNWTTVARKI
jgi:hypothetical protein